MEYMDIERVQYELGEVLNLWARVRAEPLFLQSSSNSIFTDFINPQAGGFIQEMRSGLRTFVANHVYGIQSLLKYFKQTFHLVCH